MKIEVTIIVITLINSALTNKLLLSAVYKRKLHVQCMLMLGGPSSVQSAHRAEMYIRNPEQWNETKSRTEPRCRLER